MDSQLAGRKGVFLWNWSALGENPTRTAAEFIEETGVEYVLLKAWDGDHWFDQGYSWRDCCAWLRGAGVPIVGAWGYQLLASPEREAELAAECVSYGLADVVVLNCEDPAVETMPAPDIAAVKFFDAYRAAMPETETWFCSHAQPNYHVRQPYWQALQAGCGMMPMCYHGAMQMSPHSAVDATLEDYARFSLDRNGVLLAGDAYTTGRYGVTSKTLANWSVYAMSRGSLGLCWWSMDELLERPDLRAAIGQVSAIAEPQ